jgi:CTP:molybdopterin cytidylyltransferase MocA
MKGAAGHPVLVDQRYFGELLHLDRERGLRGFFEQHRAETLRLPVPSPFIARDLDTWEDYVALHQEVFGKPPPQF